jgi:hypothetical protein
MLRRLDICLDTLWGDQPHIMAMLAASSGPIVGTPTRVHAHAQRRQLRDTWEPGTARQALPEPHLPGVIHLHEVKDERAISIPSTLICCAMGPASFA